MDVLILLGLLILAGSVASVFHRGFRIYWLFSLLTATALAFLYQAFAYLDVDHLNTPRLITNDQGQTVWRWDQAEPFGVNVASEDPDGNAVPVDMASAR